MSETKKTLTVAVPLNDIRDRLMNDLMNQRHTYTDEDGNEMESASPLLEAICEKVATKAHEQFAERIREAVDATIKEALACQLIAGFTTCDQWGHKSEAKTLNQLIQEALTARRRSSFNSPERTMMEELVTTAVTEAMQKDFAMEVKEVRESFSKQVRAKLGEAAADAIACAMGVR
jgi:hypothetical protein